MYMYVYHWACTCLYVVCFGCLFEVVVMDAATQFIHLTHASNSHLFTMSTVIITFKLIS